jgi:putative effector of murein hydrolase
MTASLATMISDHLQSPVVAVVLTWVAFEVGRWVQGQCRGSALANPVLIASALIIVLLKSTNVSYDYYMRGAGFIHFLLGPAAVALAVPIYDNLDRIRRSAASILAGITVGATVACAAAIGFTWWLGASPDVVRSIAPKSVTTPIAIGISEQIGGLPSMTVVFVIATGISGAMLLRPLFRSDWGARLGGARHRRWCCRARYRHCADPRDESDSGSFCRVSDRTDRLVHCRPLASRSSLAAVDQLKGQSSGNSGRLVVDYAFPKEHHGHLFDRRSQSPRAHEDDGRARCAGVRPVGPQSANLNQLIGTAARDSVSGTASHRSYLCEIRPAT